MFAQILNQLQKLLEKRKNLLLTMMQSWSVLQIKVTF